MMETTDETPIDSMWNYADPAGSEATFRAAIESLEAAPAGGAASAAARRDRRLELVTQIARTHSMRRRFPEAHALLDEVEAQIGGAGPGPGIRLLLERGRCFNSAGEKELARALFERAWREARAARRDGLEVDAAHMVAITWSGSLEAIEWNGRGLETARSSSDAKARSLVPALLNNSAWDLHAMGRFDDALARFREAETACVELGNPGRLRVARWAVARCLRSLARYDEALGIHRALADEHRAAGTNDGFVMEEIAENLGAMGRPDEARPYYRRAVEQLGRDDWFVRNEAVRFARLKERAGIE
jgi:tetratricopeptide (TPR) repeat protein